MKCRYLPLAYKGKVNAWIAQILELPQFSTMQARYLALADEVSKLYGNDPAEQERNREKAIQKLYTSPGNEVMDMVREGMKAVDHGLVSVRVLTPATSYDVMPSQTIVTLFPEFGYHTYNRLMVSASSTTATYQNQLWTLKPNQYSFYNSPLHFTTVCTTIHFK